MINLDIIQRPLKRRNCALNEEQGTLKKIAQKEVFDQKLLKAILETSLHLRTLILSKIVLFLNPYENSLVVRVSRKWQEVAQSGGNLYLFGLMCSYSAKSSRPFERLPLLNIGKRTFQNLDPTGRELGRYLDKRLSLIRSTEEKMYFLERLSQEQRESIQKIELSQITDEGVTKFTNFCPNVKILSVSSPSVTGSFLLNFQGRLVHLTLMGDQIQENYLKTYLKSNSQLTYLRVISQNVCGEFLMDLPNDNRLKTFTFVGDQIQEQFLNQIEKMHSLKELGVISSHVSGSFLTKIPEKLKKLHLEGNRLEDKFLYAVSLQCTRLVLLEIISDSVTGRFLNALPFQSRIQILRLRGGSFIEVYLREGIRRCQTLKSLEVVSDGLLSYFLFCLPKTLEDLYTKIELSDLMEESSFCLNRLLQRLQNVRWNLKPQLLDHISRRCNRLEMK